MWTYGFTSIISSCEFHFQSSSAEEFWPALLEKAYAKAKGSYELLNHWMPIDGCIELTGGVPERVRNLHQMLTADARHADRLFLDMLRASQLGNIILVSMPTKKTRDDKDPCLKKRISSDANQYSAHILIMLKPGSNIITPRQMHQMR